MTVVKVKGGYATKHCHGTKKGKTISKFKTEEEALKQHRAIMASKRRHNPSDDERQVAREKIHRMKGMS